MIALAIEMKKLILPSIAVTDYLDGLVVKVRMLGSLIREFSM